MKPSKKKPAKRTTAKRAVRRGSIEHKLMKLYNRIDEWKNQGDEDAFYKSVDDKKWVWTLIEDIQNKMFTKLCKEDFEKCNGLWRQYA